MASGSEKVVYSLIGDIGGTNARFQLLSFKADDSKGTDVKTQFYKTKDYKSCSECIADFLKEFKDTEKYPQNAIVAVAGAPYEGKVQITNVEWPVIDEQELSKEFQIQPFTLINDFVAIGYAMIKLNKEDYVVLNDAKRNETGAMIVAGPGTGMGECILQPSLTAEGRASYNVFGTEGGHKNFAPTSQIEWEYHNFVLEENPEIKERIGYLSTERSFCGPGIPNMYKFFCKKEGVKPEDWTSEQIIQHALAKDCKICIKVLELFVTLYAKEISNFALSSLPYGGIYLVGGLTECVSNYLINDPESPWKTAFFSKGKVVNSVLEKFPVYIVKKEELGLLGSFVKAQKDAFKL